VIFEGQVNTLGVRILANFLECTDASITGRWPGVVFGLASGKDSNGACTQECVPVDPKFRLLDIATAFLIILLAKVVCDCST
jgi:hypothetical protein